jgi:hypothetical protein
MQSQIENYRAKAREFARLATVAKSRRDARHHRKFADWALALDDEPKRFQPRQKAVLPAPNFVECATNAISPDGAGNRAS